MIEKNVDVKITCDFCKKELVNPTDGFLIEGTISDINVDRAGNPDNPLIDSNGIIFPPGERKIVVLCREHFVEKLGLVI